MRSHAVDRRAHRVLAHTERHVASPIAPYSADRAVNARAAELRILKIALAFQGSIGGWIQIRRTTHNVVELLGQGIQYLSAGGAGCQCLSSGFHFGTSAAKWSGNLPLSICSNSAASAGNACL